jgi:hypothetical protein
MSVDSSLCSFFGAEAVSVDLFAWAGVERPKGSVFAEDVAEEANRLAWVLLQGALVRIGDWIHGGGQGKPQGVMIRAFIAFWDLLPYLAARKQTELAELMGLKHKQSVGREVSDFRDRFGWRNGHMQSDAARATCREREAKKISQKDSNEE